MARFKRNALVAVASTIVLVLVLGTFVQVSSQNALERAEAFNYRRMLVTRLAAEEAYRFFYVTNRRLADNDGAVETRFGKERVEDVRFGLFDTDVEPSLGLGMLINPSDWFQNEEIRLLNVRSLKETEFTGQLRKQVLDSPYRSLLITINGFYERFPSALRKTAFLAHILDIDSPVLVFDWPGNQGSTPRGYRRAQQIARNSGKELAETIRLIVNKVRPERLWILANSMGGEVLVSAFTLLYQQPDFADPTTEIEDVVLTAPDISLKKFGRQFKREINALTQNLTVYVSSNDRALLLSRMSDVSAYGTDL